jgi:hypothetical protein
MKIFNKIAFLYTSNKCSRIKKNKIAFPMSSLIRIPMFSDTEAEDSAEDCSPTKPHHDDSDDNADYRIMAQVELKSEKAILSGHLKKKAEHRKVL